MKIYNKMKYQKHKLLMLGTSNISCEMIQYAKSLGVYTIVTDYLDPDKSIAKKISDEYWMINTSDLDRLEKKCKEENVTAAISGVSDFNITMCVQLCKRLGLPCYCTPESWHYSIDKADFKTLCKEVGAPVATDYHVTDNLSNEELDVIKFPVVVKPVDLSANRGVSYCYNKEDLVKAYKYARSLSKHDKIIVERMLHGEEWWSGYTFAEGEVRLVALNAMYAQAGEPKNCYTLTTTVSNHVEHYIKEINPHIENVLKRVGCKSGFAWVQTMLDEDGHFYIIEMGYRLTGEMIFVPYVDLLNYDAVKQLVNISLGKKEKLKELPESQTKAFERCACAMMLWTNKSGILTEIKGIDKICNIPGIHISFRHQVGEKVDKYRAMGNITFAANNCDEMCKKIEEINKTVFLLNEHGDDMIIKYTDFDYLKRVYQEGLEGK